MTGYASIHGTDNDDHIDTTGFGGRNDYVNAKDGNDTISTGGGNDTIFAGSGKDLVYAGSGNDTIYGEAAQDTLYGGSGNDVIDGGNTNDELYGESGNDRLIGGQGEDFLTGGSGNDTLTGDGSGGSLKEDVFYYESNFGDDIITDFDLNKDILEFRENINGTSIDDPADLAPYITEVGGNAVISFPNGDSITLQGVSRDDLLDGLDDVVNIV
jgi:Ca2+-binding RTX toxin-like protein